MYHPTHAVCDTPFKIYINSYMFRHVGAFLRESLKQMYTSQHARLASAPPYRNEQNVEVLKYRTLIPIN